MNQNKSAVSSSIKNIKIFFTSLNALTCAWPTLQTSLFAIRQYILVYILYKYYKVFNFYKQITNQILMSYKF